MLDPPSVMSSPSQMVTFTVRLDVPPAADQTIALVVAPAGFGTLPASVMIPVNQLSATFTLTLDAAAAGNGTVSATLGTTTLTATVSSGAAPGKIVVNEIDVDQPSTDFREFVELYNSGGQPVSLANLDLVLGNADGSTYRTVALSAAGAQLLPGQYLVVANVGVPALPTGALRINFTADRDNITNSTPRGVGVRDRSTGTMLDSMSYGGAVTGFTEGTGSVTNLKDLSTTEGSLQRKPNGVDTNQNATDFVFGTTLSPGAANP
jgi:hypothetical protein